MITALQSSYISISKGQDIILGEELHAAIDNPADRYQDKFEFSITMEEDGESAIS